MNQDLNQDNNMEHFTKKLNKGFTSTRLTSGERTSMRARVLAHMEAHPAESKSPYFFYSFQFTSTARYALAGFLVLVLTGASTTSAAQGALPGDLLYPIKISVNERVELAFATTQGEKAQVEVRLAERRVAEAQELEAEGRLNGILTAQIERHFDEHAARALAFAGNEEPQADATEAGKTGAELKQSADAPAAMTMQAEVTLEATTSVDTPALPGSDIARAKINFISVSLEVNKEILRGLKQRVKDRGGEVRGDHVERGGSSESKNNEEEHEDSNDDD